MADYNIYIHNVNGTTADSNETKAWFSNSGSQTKAWSGNTEGESFSGGISAFKSAATDTIIGGKEMMVARFAPYVAAAIAAVKLTIKVNEQIMTYMTRETGNYKIITNYNNLKSTLNAGLHPINTYINRFKQEQEERLYNQKQEQESLLVGESFNNSLNRRY